MQRLFTAVCAGVALAILSGCTGWGRMQFAALNYRAIDPPEGPAPNFNTIQVDHCYWWTDGAGNVNVAMERRVPSLLGPALAFSFQMSLVLAEPPAGRARNYSVANKELRGVARLGPSESRLTSVAGIVALYSEPGEKLRGSLRMLITREASQVLGGWSRPAAYLLLGRFVAIHDQASGERILKESESGGWERDPPESPDSERRLRGPADGEGGAGGVLHLESQTVRQPSPETPG